jgi:hypothetical protein
MGWALCMHVCADHMSDEAGLEWTVQGGSRSSIVHLGGWGVLFLLDSCMIT